MTGKCNQFSLVYIGLCKEELFAEAAAFSVVQKDTAAVAFVVPLVLSSWAHLIAPQSYSTSKQLLHFIVLKTQLDLASLARSFATFSLDTKH